MEEKSWGARSYVSDLVKLRVVKKKGHPFAHYVRFALVPEQPQGVQTAGLLARYFSAGAIPLHTGTVGKVGTTQPGWRGLAGTRRSAGTTEDWTSWTRTPTNPTLVSTAPARSFWHRPGHLAGPRECKGVSVGPALAAVGEDRDRSPG
ncbi:hypothetical protein THAOC_22419 [Thalassiosira oceanica]|uniref:Uncharacterized protein n=1 Tax=Thalassiosira oceanica TaxID=159749 RepID=K0S9C5_THAOC|nr:hypothetical protein THAOC_22419 [Thalassiosira oceanica]|eukprot:EJK57526.1 hypothetical protein THAOC_22419 [Thalassiosira oceanica]